MNLLCTRLYTKMQLMQGKNNRGLAIHFISSPLEDPSKKISKTGINPQENKRGKHSVCVWRTDSSAVRWSQVTDCKVDRAPRRVQAKGLQREFQESERLLALHDMGVGEGCLASPERGSGVAQGWRQGSCVRSLSWAVGLSESWQLVLSHPLDTTHTQGKRLDGSLLRNSLDPEIISQHPIRRIRRGLLLRLTCQAITVQEFSPLDKPPSCTPVPTGFLVSQYEKWAGSKGSSDI